MWMEISSDIFLIYLKKPMIFAFAFETSVKLVIDILRLFCKMAMEICTDIFLSIEDIDDILLLFSKTSVENFINTLHLFPKYRWKFPSTFCFYQ